MKNELYKALYQNLVSLASVAGVDEAGLQKYFVPEGDTSSQSILFHFCSSLQNSGMMRNSIKFNDSKTPYNRAVIDKILFGFDAKTAYAKYPEWRDIYNALLNEGIVDNGIGEKKETNWEKYCKGLHDGLHYLTAENGETEIRQLSAVTQLTDKEISKINVISKKIHGLGFALTCDWLKECGCAWLGKPDVHINGVLKHLKSTDTIKDADVLKELFTWAESVKSSGVDHDATAYKIDKIIWLLCTGEFYLDEKRIGRTAIYSKIDDLSKG